MKIRSTRCAVSCMSWMIRMHGGNGVRVRCVSTWTRSAAVVRLDSVSTHATLYELLRGLGIDFGHIFSHASRRSIALDLERSHVPWNVFRGDRQVRQDGRL